jgi:hypothetical protein
MRESPSTLTALSQRDGAYWLAIGLLAVGLLLPETVRLGGRSVDLAVAGQPLPPLVAGLGMAIVTVRIGVYCWRALRVSAAAGVEGYREADADTER